MQALKSMDENEITYAGVVTVIRDITGKAHENFHSTL